MPPLVPDITKGKLLGCRERHGNCTINLPIDAHNLGPWVKVRIKGENERDDDIILESDFLTVGNKSCFGCEPLHTAVIKSFEYGTSDGFVVKLVIHDQAGGSFFRFAQAMNTDFNRSTSNYRAVVKWGWVGVLCGNESIIAESEPVTFIITSISTNMSEGKIVYEVEGTDLWKNIMQGRAFETIGDDNNPVSLKEAIRRLFAGPPDPVINDIQFLRRLPDGKTETVEFKEAYRAKWHPANRTKIAVALDWLRPYLTDRDKSCTDYTWNSGGSKPGIIFWEDASKNTTKCSSLGTYIVNGGELSPVISFQPKFHWNHTHLSRSGGVAAGPHSSNVRAGDRKVANARDGLGQPGAGNQIGGQSIDHEDVGRNRSLGADQISETIQAEAQSYLTRTPLSHPVEADLVIQGDPTISGTREVYKNWVSLIVINPFHLVGSRSDNDPDCPDWTLKPPCNELASNSQWIIFGINHSIREGSYVTTLKLYLHGPGVDKPIGTQLGGSGPVIN